MRANLSFLHAAAIASFLFCHASSAQTIAPQPYASIATDGETYQGPGRSPANDLSEKLIRIGMLAPLQGPRKPEGDAMLAAARMALHDALPLRNHRIELAIEDASAPQWGTLSDAILRLVLDDNVVAFITSTSASETHLTEQVANRIGLPVLTLSTDPTTTQINIPWIFRIGPSDAEQAHSIAPDDPTAANRQAFATRFQALTGAPPTNVATQTYDAVTLTLRAIRAAGPNRARVRDQLSHVQAYEGASGQITFDRQGNNHAAHHLEKQ
jgi:ABC-type branched-subunit amino acid transport system substrate-binding protein